MNNKLCDENIWYTKKARIIASKRLLSNSFHSQMLLVWYSLTNVILSIVLIQKPDVFGELTNIIMAIFAVILLTISLIVQNWNFKDRYLLMQNNYIDLGVLYEECRQETDKKLINEKYSKLLKEIENHKDIDDISFRAFRCDISRKLSVFEYGIFFIYKILRYSFLFLLYFVPIIGFLIASI